MYRKSTIAGNTRRVRRGSTRDIPVYRRPGITRKLVHVSPLVSGANQLNCNNGSNQASYPWIAPLCLVAEGSGIDSRRGDRIYMRSLILNVAFNANTFVDHHCRIRLAVVYDTDPTGTVPLVTDIFDSTDPLSFPRLETRSRFQIMYMREIDMEYMPVVISNVVTYRAGVGTEPHFRLDIPINRMMQYKPTAATGTLADITKGALYLCVSSPVLPDGGPPILHYSHRVTFDDLA